MIRNKNQEFYSAGAICQLGKSFHIFELLFLTCKIREVLEKLTFKNLLKQDFFNAVYIVLLIQTLGISIMLIKHV